MPALRALAATLLAISCAVVARADWPQFRGPNGAGIAEGPPPPVEFGPGQHLLWRTALPSGHSSPCVVGDSIFLTTFDGDARRLEVLRIARADGSILWRRTVPAEDIEKGHPSFNPASGTPASDGERVVAYFGSFGLICFEVDGDEAWRVPMPLAKSYCGNAASPVIVGDRVILYRGNYVDHFLLAVDKRTGKELWRTPQEERFTTDMACTATPVVAGDLLIIHGARTVQGFDIATGERRWLVRCSTTGTSTPVLAGDEVVVATWNQTGEPELVPEYPSFEEALEKHDADGDGALARSEFPRLMVFHRTEGTDAPENGAPVRFANVDSDKSGKVDEKEWAGLLKWRAEFRASFVSHGILAIPLASEGVLDSDRVRNLERQGVPEVPSPIVHEGRVYFVKNGGILTCVDLASGKRTSRLRTGGRGTHYASPVVADGKLYSTAGDGRISVLALGPEPKILATNDLGERVYATPAIVDGVIYVRTHESLLAFAQGAESPDETGEKGSE